MKKEEADKCKFFAQYYGQEILRWHQWLDSTENGIVDLTTPGIEKDGWSIRLKSINDITEKDAEVLQYTLINVIGLDGIIKGESVDLVRDVASNYAQVDCLFMLPSSFSDKLRELGYAFDWNGYKVSDLIKRNWINII